MVELKGHQQQEMEGKLWCHSCLTLMGCTFASLKVRNLKVPMQGTCCKQVTAVSPVQWLPAAGSSGAPGRVRKGRREARRGQKGMLGARTTTQFHSGFRPLKMKVLVPRLCPTLGNPMGCSPPGSSVHGILQAREREAIPFSRGSS